MSLLAPLGLLGHCNQSFTKSSLPRRAASTLVASSLRSGPSTFYGALGSRNRSSDKSEVDAHQLARDRTLWSSIAKSKRPLLGFYNNRVLSSNQQTFSSLLTRQSPSRLLPSQYFSRLISTSAFKRSSVNLATLHDEPTPHSKLPPLPTLTHPIVAYYLIGIATLVFAIVVIGGLTRLTESGLSITEWNLVTGTLPPLNEDDWIEELRKYRLSPEGRLLNKNITMSEFKNIYLMEYGHRLLGRVIGLAFLLPIPFFAYKRMISRPTARTLALIATLIGCQGALGWYMVKSGLTQEALAEANPSGVPRVSQYRLAAHLGMAFAVYALTVRAAQGILQDWKLVKGDLKAAQSVVQVLHSKMAGRMRLLAGGMTALVFLTAISGAFVAGLDAGLLYNTFPYMGDRIVPPTAELYDPSYARKADQSDLIRRNVFENPTTVQFDHRVLAITTFTSAIALAIYASRPAIRSGIPRIALRHVREIAAMATIQASLGISTLVYLVPTTLASLHQAGSLVLLTFSVMAVTSLRRPGYVAHVWLRRQRPLATTNL